MILLKASSLIPPFFILEKSMVFVIIPISLPLLTSSFNGAMMDLTIFLNSDIYTWFILPLLIFIARILDVSIGTVRVIFINRGYKYIAPALGFVEVSIWLLAIRQVMTHLDNVVGFLAYALGFAAGTFVGIVIEEKLSIGKVVIRIVTKKDATQLVQSMRAAKCGVTV